MINKALQIIGIGTDILSIERFNHSYLKLKEPFLDKIFTENEKFYCNKYKEKISHFAARFCAKEAVAKALGDGFNEFLTFQDIEIIHNEKNKPLVVLSKRSTDYYSNPIIEISLSHCKEYATATAIAFSL